MRSPSRLRSLALALLAGLAVAAPAPAGAAALRAALQPPSEEERERQREQARERAREERERARERAERDRERARERAERERDRARERADRERDERDERGRDDETVAQGPTRIDTTVSIGRDGTVDLSLVSGDVTVTSWGRGEVQVRGSSERLPLRFEHTGDRVRVWVPSSRIRGRAGEQRLEVVVPVGTRVSAQSVSGDVSVRGVRGEVEAGAVSGDVDVQDAVRRVLLKSVSGGVRGTNLDGEVRASAVSGDVTLEDVQGDVNAETVSGEALVRRARTSRLHLQSVSGDLSYDGTITRDGRYELTSHSGEIQLALPSDVGASLSLRTFSGSFDSDFELTMRADGRESSRRGPRDRRMDFTLGGGGATIVAETFSGSIKLARAGSRR